MRNWCKINGMTCGNSPDCIDCEWSKNSIETPTSGKSGLVPGYIAPPLPGGITYGGKGPGGEFYSKDLDEFSSCSLWTEGEESWTADELEAIAKHKRFVDSKG